MWLFRILLALFCLFLAGCFPFGGQIATIPTDAQGQPFPTNPLYVMASAVGNRELLVVDPTTWQIVRRTQLLSAGISDFSRDPQGRIWLGYGAQPGVDERVQVFASNGKLLKTFTICADPFHKIHFAAGRAFIPCSENGYYASVVVVDLQTLEVQTKVEVGVEGDTFLLACSGGNEHFLALYGGGDTETNHFLLMDTHTLEIVQTIPMPYAAIRMILNYQEKKFLLLNSNPEPNLAADQRTDLLVVDVANGFKRSAYPMKSWGALWGTIDGDMLYTYHNIEENGLREDPHRWISRLDLRTHKSEQWPLPDHWNAKDIAIVNGEIILAHSVGIEPETGGLYRFDPATGELMMLVNIPNAKRILWSGAQEQ